MLPHMSCTFNQFFPFLIAKGIWPLISGQYTAAFLYAGAVMYKKYLVQSVQPFTLRGKSRILLLNRIHVRVITHHII